MCSTPPLDPDTHIQPLRDSSLALDQSFRFMKDFSNRAEVVLKLKKLNQVLKVAKMRTTLKWVRSQSKERESNLQNQILHQSARESKVLEMKLGIWRRRTGLWLLNCQRREKEKWRRQRCYWRLSQRERKTGESKNHRKSWRGGRSAKKINPPCLLRELQPVARGPKRSSNQSMIMQLEVNQVGKSKRERVW